MTDIDKKREEIREGIARAIPPLDCCYCVHFGYCTWDKKGLCEAGYELADSISNYLHSQGVVIEVDSGNYGHEACGSGTATEPLIEE